MSGLLDEPLEDGLTPERQGGGGSCSGDEIGDASEYASLNLGLHGLQGGRKSRQPTARDELRVRQPWAVLRVGRRQQVAPDVAVPNDCEEIELGHGSELQSLNLIAIEIYLGVRVF